MLWELSYRHWAFHSLFQVNFLPLPVECRKFSPQTTCILLFIVGVASLHLHEKSGFFPRPCCNFCFSLHIYVKEVRSKIRVSCRELWFLLLCPWSFKFSSGAIFILPGERFLEFILEQVCWQQILFTSLHWRVSLFCLNFWRIFNGYRILGWHFDSVST